MKRVYVRTYFPPCLGRISGGIGEGGECTLSGNRWFVGLLDVGAEQLQATWRPSLGRIPDPINELSASGHLPLPRVRDHKDE